MDPDGNKKAARHNKSSDRRRRNPEFVKKKRSINTTGSEALRTQVLFQTRFGSIDYSSARRLARETPQMIASFAAACVINIASVHRMYADRGRALDSWPHDFRFDYITIRHSDRRPAAKITSKTNECTVTSDEKNFINRVCTAVPCAVVTDDREK